MKKSKFTVCCLTAISLSCFAPSVYGETNEVMVEENIGGLEAVPVEVQDEVEVESSLPQEGETVQGDGYTSVVDWYEYDGNRIFGRFYYPEDFDETEQYTTVLLCHGGSITADIWDAVYAPRLAQQGYVCYALDCRSGTGDKNTARVTYSDPTPDGTASVMTYAEDMNAAMTFVKSKVYTDPESLYLMGQSQGGMTSQILAAQRPEEVAGVVVLYGSVMDKYKEDIENYAELEAHPYNNGEVLFVQGTEDNFRTEQDTLENMKWYEKTSFVLISEAYHGFGSKADRPSVMCADEVINYIERTKGERNGDSYSGFAASEEQRAQTEEGYTFEGEGYSVSVSWIESENGRIFGRFYYPEDFDETEQYTTVLLCHGGSITADIWDAVYAPRLAQQGYVCYALDCRSGTGDKNTARVTYSDPTPDGTASAETYSEDLLAGLDFVEEKSFVDQQKIYLMGQSLGGLTVQNVASKRADEIAGVIVLYGSIAEDNKNMFADYENLKENAYNNGEVLFIQGTEDVTLSPERTIENMEWYEKTALVLINDAYHGFGNSPSRPAEICIESVLDFISTTSAQETIEE